MEYFEYDHAGVNCRLALFAHGRAEAQAIFTISDDRETVASEIESINSAVVRTAERFGLQPVFMRWLLSDAANQAGFINPTPPWCQSIIQQTPLGGSHIAAFVMFESNPTYIFTTPGIWMDDKNRIIIGDIYPLHNGDSAYMTHEYLSVLDAVIAGLGGNLADHCLRTWFFVRDIDNNYVGLVKARNDFFDAHGLTRDTHFIASTGIAGQCADPKRTVSFNALADAGVKASQFRFLKGYTHLSPTAEYGVAFERGVAIDRGDRTQVYISGTASIDNKGDIVHPGDIAKQTERMLTNIEVLLAEAGCGWSDTGHIIVYLRDIADRGVVSKIIDGRVGNVPRVIVWAPVCRPGWLVEAECMAVKKIDCPQYEAF